MWPLYVLMGIAVVPMAGAVFIKNKIVKALLCAAALFGAVLSAALLGGFVFPQWMGIHGLWFAFALCGVVFTVGMLFVWKPFQVKARRILALGLAGALVLTTAGVLGPKIYKQLVLDISTEDVNLRQYMPFGDKDSEDPDWTLAKTLNEESTLELTENLPRLDGATALYPLYSAFVRAAYPPGEYFPYDDLRADGVDAGTEVACSTTSYAFQNLIDGYADIVFLMGVSDEQRAAAEERGLELSLTPIGREAFIFFVNTRNAVSNLSVDDIKKIYAGQVVNWQEVGGPNDEIRAYQRPDESGSQTMLKVILDGSPLMSAPQEDIFDFMMGMVQRVADYQNYRNSLGYSFRFYVQGMTEENRVRFLSVDGIAPTRENIENGAYPFANDFYAVTVKRKGAYLNPERTESIEKLIAWMRSPQGQLLVDATGYVPLHDHCLTEN